MQERGGERKTGTGKWCSGKTEQFSCDEDSPSTVREDRSDRLRVLGQQLKRKSDLTFDPAEKLKFSVIMDGELSCQEASGSTEATGQIDTNNNQVCVFFTFLFQVAALKCSHF